MNVESKKIFAGVVLIILVMGFMLFAMNINRFKHSGAFEQYVVYATFDKTGSLGVGDNVFVSGLKSGRVADISLKDDFRVLVKLELNIPFKLPEDSVISVMTDGLMGGKYIDISVGGEIEEIENGGFASYTQSPIELDELIEQILAMARKKNEKTKVE